MRGIKLIETLYRGYRFRSRLEARWAVFFDVAGVAWQYEPEGFDLTNVRVPRVYDPNGPDLPPVRVWNEPEDMQAYAPLWYPPLHLRTQPPCSPSANWRFAATLGV
jgi:hypothetical protein